MTYKKYKTTKENKINDNFIIPAGAIVEINWDGADGAWFKYDGQVGCPWIDSSVVEYSETQEKTTYENEADILSLIIEQMTKLSDPAIKTLKEYINKECSLRGFEK